jgi:multiple sugar transport system ATP-binding protein
MYDDAAYADSGRPHLDVEDAVLPERGSDAHFTFPVDAPRVDAAQVRAAREEDEDVLAADDAMLFNARVDPRTNARRGGALRLAVDPGRLHFFDVETGEALTGAA